MASIGDDAKSPNDINDTNVTNDNDNDNNDNHRQPIEQNRNHNNKRQKKRRRRGDDNPIIGIGANALRTNSNKKPTNLPSLRRKNNSYADAATKWESVQIYSLDPPKIEYRNAADILSWGTAALNRMHYIQAEREANKTRLTGWFVEDGSFISDKLISVNWNKLGLNFCQAVYDKTTDEANKYDYLGMHPTRSNGKVIILCDGFTDEMMSNRTQVMRLLDNLAIRRCSHPLAMIEHNEYEYFAKRITMKKVDELMACKRAQRDLHKQINDIIATL
eukprot:886035_1